jgi:phosphate transport system substrate-binding protein
MKRLAGIALAVLALGGVALAQSSSLINGAGATFPNPIYSKWFDEFHKANGTEINYQSVGSGAGIKQVTEGTVDFGATDGPMNDEQLKAYRAKNGAGILHFPTVLGAVVPTYNVPGVSTGLNFTPDALAGIFLGRVSKWNDPTIANANKGVNLPANLDRLPFEDQSGLEGQGQQRNLRELAGGSWRQGQRRCDRIDQADAKLDRIR